MKINAFFHVIADAGFQSAAFFVCVTGLFFTLVRSKPKRLQNKIFILILLDILLASMCDINQALIGHSPDMSQMMIGIQEMNIYLYFLIH